MNGGVEDCRVVMTGIGMITPFGPDRESSWAGIRSGESAIGWVNNSHDGAPFDRPVVGAKAPLPESAVGPTSEPVIELAGIACDEAVADAQLDFSAIPRARIGCVIGTSKGGLLSIERALRGENVAANWMNFPASTPAAIVAQRYGLQGPALCSVAACATGVVCLQRGYELIRDRYCDVVLAGSTDASLLPSIAASYRRLGVIATNFDLPETACRPFDRDRSGFAIGEGAAVIVMERAQHAQWRGATPYAEWAAGGTAGEAHDITRLSSDPATLVRLIRTAVDRSGLRPEEIDYCNLHGTATIPNDVYESSALKAAFGPAAKNIPCSSVKGAIGHLLGAAGSVETATTLLAMRDGIIPPTINLTNADPACDLDYTATNAREKPIHAAMKLSLGFGGHLAVAMLRAV